MTPARENHGQATTRSRSPGGYRVGTAGGTKFATVVQRVVTANDGTTTISKAGASVTFKLTDGETTHPGALY